MSEEIIVAFAVGLISGLLIMGIIAAASNIRWSCRDREEKKLDAWQQGVEQGYEIGLEHGKYEIMKGLVEYLNLDNYDDTDGIKVKYIRQFINKKEDEK